ncbi:MAG: class I SAM-dependent methyltransferase [Syntrophales bacterium]
MTPLNQIISGSYSDSFRFVSCPCCESGSLVEEFRNPTSRKIENWRQFFYGGKDYIPRIIRCRECGYGFIDPVNADAARYYREAKTGDYGQLTLQRRKYFSAVKRQIEQHGVILPSMASILDLGAASGEWLAFWKGSAKLYATEANPNHISTLEDNGVIVSLNAKEFKNKFDLISAFDFLEHVPDPRDTIMSLIKLLNPGGYLVLGVPDMGKWAVRLLGIRYYLYCPMHMSYFTSTSLSVLLKKLIKNNPQVFKSPPMFTSLSGALKWLMPEVRLSLFDKIAIPIGYRASLIATVQVNV